MDWTDVHYRQLARFISKHTYLYTEMVVDSTLIHNPNTDKCGPPTAAGLASRPVWLPAALPEALELLAGCALTAVEASF